MRPERSFRATAVTRAAWLPAALCGVCAGLALGGPPVLAALDYRRDAIAGGAWWRLATAHLVHLDASHATLDIAALALVAWIFVAELGPAAQALVFVVGIAAIDAGLWFADPEVMRYAGLSGVLHAWFAAGAASWAIRGGGRTGRARERRAWGVALSVALVLKLALEARGHAFWLAGFDGPVVSAAHHWGALGGWVAASAFVARRPP